ncbi:MAG: hypothetical protein V1907_03905 [Candidatus Kerfeldbacteria bacterium]
MKLPVKIALFIAGAGLATTGFLAMKEVTAESTGVDTAVTAATTSAALSITPTVVDRHQQKLDEMAKLLGITADELKSKLESGKEFYQIAASNGVTYDKLKSDAETKFKARLDDMVKVGFLTQDEANTMLKQYQDNSQNMPMFGMGFGMGRGFHHGPGF